MFNKNQHHSVGAYNFYEPHAEMHGVILFGLLQQSFAMTMFLQVEYLILNGVVLLLLTKEVVFWFFFAIKKEQEFCFF